MMKTPAHSARSRRCQRGLALVETTIFLPLLLLLAFLCAEFGWILMQYNTLNKAQQDGARYLASRATLGGTGVITLDSSAPDGNAYVTRNLIVYGNAAGTGTPLLPGLKTGDVSIANSATPGHVRINVNYAFVPIFGNVFSMFGYGSDLSLNFPLRSSVLMRAL